jgi:hypothetical protein
MTLEHPAEAFKAQGRLKISRNFRQPDPVLQLRASLLAISEGNPVRNTDDSVALSDATARPQ